MILPSDTYVNFLIYLAGHSYFPRIILKLLSQKKLVAVLNKDEYKKMFGLFKRLFEGAKLINKGFTAMLKGDFSKIFHYLKRQFEPVK